MLTPLENPIHNGYLKVYSVPFLISSPVSILFPSKGSSRWPNCSTGGLTIALSTQLFS